LDTAATPLVVQLSSSDYVVEESTGEVCLVVVANGTTSEPYSVYVMPIAEHPISATGKPGYNDIIIDVLCT